jgi:hypothetical protein
MADTSRDHLAVEADDFSHHVHEFGNAQILPGADIDEGRPLYAEMRSQLGIVEA